MNILITGGAGYIGSSNSYLLIKKKIKIIINIITICHY